MPASVAAAIGAGLDLGPGDQVVLNDPFAGGTHLNDVTLVAPCHAGGRLVGWVANRAHHADVGGMAPGSIPPGGDRDLPGGASDPAAAADPGGAPLLLEANSRTPAERRGDLEAQAGANRVGVAPAGSPGRAPAWPTFDEVLGYGERRMRAALEALPDGAWQAEDVLDSTGAGLGRDEPAGRHPAAADHRGLGRHVRLQPAPSRSSPATSTPWRP